MHHWILFLLAVTAIHGCHESAVQIVPDDSSDSESAPEITGRDSAHSVPIDTNWMDTVSDATSTSVSSIDSNTGTENMVSGDTDSVSDTLVDTTAPTDSSADSDIDTGTNVFDTSDAFETDTSDTLTETWTLMMYMAADSNLETDMMADLQEMAAIQLPQWLNILILFDRHQYYDSSDGNWTGTRLFKVNPAVDGGLERLADDTFLLLSNAGDNEELDLGNGAVLDDFIGFSTATYPAAHYGLIISGHGNGWMKKGEALPSAGPRVICTDDSGTVEGISVQRDLKAVLQAYAIDVLGFDACLMGMVETAWALKDSVKYMIASEANEASYGWDFLTWITQWVDSGDRSALSLTQKQVAAYRRYHDSTVPPWLMTMSVVDMQKLDALGTAISHFVASYKVSDFIGQAMNFDDDYSEYYDLLHIALLAGDANLQTAIDDAVVYRWHSGSEAYPGGLSIMYLADLPADYLQTSFCKDVDWCQIGAD